VPEGLPLGGPGPVRWHHLGLVSSQVNPPPRGRPRSSCVTGTICCHHYYSDKCLFGLTCSPSFPILSFNTCGNDEFIPPSVTCCRKGSVMPIPADPATWASNPSSRCLESNESFLGPGLTFTQALAAPPVAARRTPRGTSIQPARRRVRKGPSLLSWKLKQALGQNALWLIVLAIGLLGLVGLLGQTKQTSSTATDIAVTASELCRSYDADHAAANQVYNGKIIGVSGRVHSLGMHFSNCPYVLLQNEGAGSGSTVRCFFSTDHRSELKELAVGQWITIHGHCRGKSFNVIVADCSVSAFQDKQGSARSRTLQEP
jgi:hypothetical protein